MKKIKGKYALIVVLLLLEVIALTFMYKSSHNKEIVLDEVSLKELLKSDMISIMTDETGNGTYTEYTNSTFPSTGYEFNASQSQCINEKGNVINNVLSYDGTKAILTSNEGMHCTLYFDIVNSLLKTLRKNDTKDQLTDDLVGGMYRYQGTTDVNNWICFGTTDKNTCLSDEGRYKYLYRIIGVTTDENAKLILADVLRDNEGRLGAAWWASIADECNCVTPLCTWVGSTLFNEINGIRYGVHHVFKNSNYYSYLNQIEWDNLIDKEHIWKYGDIPDKTTISSNYNGNNVYQAEQYFLTKTVKAEMGAPYIHDYLLSYPGGNPGSYDNAAKAWMNEVVTPIKDSILNYGAAFWTIVREKVEKLSYDNMYAVRAYAVGGGYMSTSNYDPQIYTRPVFFLKKNVKIKSGTGTISDPFIINTVSTQTPTCNFTLFENQVSLVTDNATSWYISTAKTTNPSYGTGSKYVDIGTHTYYGYVKNASGVGTCEIDLYQPKLTMCTVSKTQNETSSCTTTGSTSSGTHNCIVTGGYGAQVCHYEVWECGKLALLSSGTTSSCDGYNYNTCGPQSNYLGTYANCSCTSGQTVYACEDGNSYSTSSECTSKKCSGTTYTCSDGSTCTTANCCSAKTCTTTEYQCSNGETYDSNERCIETICSSETCKTGYNIVSFNEKLTDRNNKIFCYK